MPKRNLATESVSESAPVFLAITSISLNVFVIFSMALAKLSALLCSLISSSVIIFFSRRIASRKNNYFSKPDLCNNHFFNNIFGSAEISSIYMDSQFVCFGFCNQPRDVFSLLSSTYLDTLRTFGQTLVINEPFYIYESDFTNYLNVNDIFTA